MIVPFVTNENTTKCTVITTSVNSATTLLQDTYRLNVLKTPPHFTIIISPDYDQDVPYVGKSDTTGQNAEIINASLVIKMHRDTKPAIVLKIIETDLLWQTVLQQIIPSFLPE